MRFQCLGSLSKPYELERLPQENDTNQAVIWTLLILLRETIWGFCKKKYCCGILTISSLPTLFDFVIPNADCLYQYIVNEANRQYSRNLEVTIAEHEGLLQLLYIW